MSEKENQSPENEENSPVEKEKVFLENDLEQVGEITLLDGKPYSGTCVDYPLSFLCVNKLLRLTTLYTLFPFI